MAETLDTKVAKEMWKELSQEDSLHIMTGPTELPIEYLYGFDCGIMAENHKASPLGASAALLDLDEHGDGGYWWKKVEELYIDYFKPIAEAKKKFPGIVGKIIAKTNTFKLSKANAEKAKDDISAYGAYFDPREESMGLTTGTAEDGRNYHTIRRLLDENTPEWIVNIIARESVKVIKSALHKVGLDDDDVYIFGDIGPESNPYAERMPERPDDYFRKYHLPTVRALKISGADVILSGTIARASELIGGAHAAEEEDIPFVGSGYGDDRDMFLHQSRGTYFGVTISDLMNLNNFVGAGSNCRDTLSIYKARISVADSINRGEPGVSPDALDYLFLAYANASTQPPYVLDEHLTPHRIDPYIFATGLYRLYNAGFTVLGGCCGTDPKYYEEAIPLLVEGIAKNRTPKEIYLEQHPDKVNNNKVTTG